MPVDSILCTSFLIPKPSKSFDKALEWNLTRLGTVGKLQNSSVLVESRLV